MTPAFELSAGAIAWALLVGVALRSLTERRAAWMSAALSGGAAAAAALVGLEQAIALALFAMQALLRLSGQDLAKSASVPLSAITTFVSVPVAVAIAVLGFWQEDRLWRALLATALAAATLPLSAPAIAPLALTLLTASTVVAVQILRRARPLRAAPEPRSALRWMQAGTALALLGLLFHNGRTASVGEDELASGALAIGAAASTGVVLGLLVLGAMTLLAISDPAREFLLLSLIGAGLGMVLSPSGGALVLLPVAAAALAVGTLRMTRHLVASARV